MGLSVSEVILYTAAIILESVIVPLYGVERLSASRKLEKYAKNQSVLSICSFYGGCPHLGGSVKRGSIVYKYLVPLVHRKPMDRYTRIYITKGLI